MRKLWRFLCVLFVVAMAVCVIVNLAVSGTLDWALYPLLCIAFAWGVLAPLLLAERNRLQYMLCALCVLIFPFLMLLDRVTPVHGWAKALGMPIAGVSVVYIAGVYATIRYARWNTPTRIAAIVLGAGIVSGFVELLVARYIGQTLHPAQLIDVIACAGVAAVLLLIGRTGARRGA